MPKAGSRCLSVFCRCGHCGGRRVNCIQGEGPPTEHAYTAAAIAGCDPEGQPAMEESHWGVDAFPFWAASASGYRVRGKYLLYSVKRPGMDVQSDSDPRFLVCCSRPWESCRPSSAAIGQLAASPQSLSASFSD